MPKATPYQPIDQGRLLLLAEAAGEKIRAQISESADKICKDYAETVDEAHLNAEDKLPKMKLSYSITLTPASGQTDFDLKWTVTHTVSETVMLDDPKQPKLKL